MLGYLVHVPLLHLNLPPKLGGEALQDRDHVGRQALGMLDEQPLPPITEEVACKPSTICKSKGIYK